MKEIALNRGFYPIVALGPEAMGGRGRGEGRGQKARKREECEGQRQGQEFFYEENTHNEKAYDMSGLRRPSAISSSTTSSLAKVRSTLSGSIAAHGPRFKR